MFFRYEGTRESQVKPVHRSKPVILHSTLLYNADSLITNDVGDDVTGNGTMVGGVADPHKF